MQRRRKLFNQRKRRLYPGKECGERLNGTEHVVQKLHEDDRSTGRDALSRNCHRRGDEEHAELQDRAGDPGRIVDVDVDAGALL